ncbi:sensor histidine kinase [Algoriphagus sanaruensis]|nr:HAMP domain-containing sensor histidine kinase [Algoriphagus sanaruensis]
MLLLKKLLCGYFRDMSLFSSEKEVKSLIDLQNEMSRTAMLLGSILFIAFGLSNLLTEVPIYLIVGKLAIGALFLFGYWFTKKQGQIQVFLNILLFICFFLLSVNYFKNHGSYGATVVTLFILTLTCVVLIDGWVKWFWIVLGFLIFTLFLFLEIFEIVPVDTTYEEPSSRFVAITLGLFWTILFTSIGVWILQKNYHDQYRLLIKFQKEKEKANLQLSELNDKKSKLLALLSHDLRSPINTLTLSLELFEMGALDEDKLKQMLGNLKKQSHHLSHVLENTMSWVRIELGEEKFSRNLVDIDAFTQEMIEMMQEPISLKELSLSFLKEGDNQTVELEAKPISIILKNLIDNAVKFTQPEQEVTLKLSQKPGHVSWEVSNPGLPLAGESLSNLFTPRIESQMGTQNEKGSGIGLLMSKEIAESLDMELTYSYADGHHKFTLSGSLD